MPRTRRTEADFLGKRFGRLIVTACWRHPKRGLMCRVLCDCGEEDDAIGYNLMGGQKTSCGCAFREMLIDRNTTHGKHDHDIYRIWCSMRQRCTDPQHSDYPRYGGRGIKVCDRWRQSFDAFLADMGDRPSPKHSLDRIDYDGDYTPENCRWATDQEQAHNRSDNRHIEAFGRSRLLCEWAEESGIPVSTLRNRIDRFGWPPDRALTTPCRNGNRLRTQNRNENPKREE